MQLTKEQIKYIDDYLIKSGIKHCDIRFEMIDQLASQLENEDNFNLDEEYLKKEIGTSSKLKKVEWQESIFINKKYKRLLFNEIKQFFSSLKFSLLFVFLYIVEFYLFKKLSSSLFLKINIVLIIIPVVIPLIIIIKNGIDYGLSKWKSRNLDYALHYSLFSFVILNGIFQFLRPNGFYNLNPNILPVVLIFLIPIHFLFSFCGTKIYIKTYKEYSNLFNEQKKINAT